MTRLLTLLRARPDDEELRQVWGDELLAAGDPRGEFVALAGHLGRAPRPGLAARLGRLPGLDRDGDPLPSGAVARLGSGGAPVSGLTFAADGQLLAWRRGDDLWVQLLDEDRRLARLPGGAGLTALALDRSHVALATATNVTIWSLDDLEARALPGGGATALAFAPDGRLASAGAGPLRLWRLEGHTPSLELEVAREGAALAVAAGDGWVAAAGDDATFRRWEGAGATPRIFALPELAPARAAAIDVDGRSCAFLGGVGLGVVSADQRLLLDDAEDAGWASATLVHLIAGGALAVGAPGRFRVVDLATGAEDAVELPGHTTAVAFSSTRGIAAGGRLGVELVNPRRRVAADDFHGDVLSLAFAPDGRTLLAAADERRLQRFALDGRPLPPWATPDLCWVVAFAPGGRRVALAGRGWLSLRDADGREELRVELERQPWSVVWSPSEERLLVLAADAVHTIDVARGRQGPLALDAPAISGVAFSPDGTRLAVAQRTGLAILDAASLAPLHNVAGTTGQVFYAAGRLVTLAGSGQLVARDPDGAPLETVDLGHGAGAFALSFDRRWLAVQVLDGTVQLWDLSHFTLRARLPLGEPRALAISPDGELVAAAGFREVLVYDASDAGCRARGWS